MGWRAPSLGVFGPPRKSWLFTPMRCLPPARPGKRHQNSPSPSPVPFLARIAPDVEVVFVERTTASMVNELVKVKLPAASGTITESGPVVNRKAGVLL